MRKFIKLILLTVLCFTGIFLGYSKNPDPNFYIFLCFGQSNMEGQGTIESKDKIVNSRFKVMAAVDCPNLGRTKGNWYTAVPPLCRCYTGLSPVDYFGRTMVENLPDSISIGIINVSVAGCKIELFDKEQYASYAENAESWMKNIIAEYGGNPYECLLEMARLAQNDGVIKGILIHQGESNTGESTWPAKVKKVYDTLLHDLGLEPNSIPLLAGEVVHADQGGICASMNPIIAKLPETIPNSYVISSSQCPDQSDNLHFNSIGYRKLGIRYAVKMLSLMGIQIAEPHLPEDPTGTQTLFYETECTNFGSNWNIANDSKASNGFYINSKVSYSNTEKPDTSAENKISFSFTTTKDSLHYVYMLQKTTSTDNNAFWLQIDNNEPKLYEGLISLNWKWIKVDSFELTKGTHQLFLYLAEQGYNIDKISISNYSIMPTGISNPATNKCTPSVGTQINNYQNIPILEQNYPNPFSHQTVISFYLPENSFVSLKVYNAMGSEMFELAGKHYNKGLHSVTFNSSTLSDGLYQYILRTNNYMEVKKMQKLSVK